MTPDYILCKSPTATEKDEQEWLEYVKQLEEMEKQTMPEPPKEDKC